MNLSIQSDRYRILVKEWTKFGIKDQTFTSWVTSVLESAISRTSHIKQQYPDYHTIITTDGSFIIENKNELVKVFVNDKGELDCTATANKESYIRFAALHPMFNVSV